MNHDMCITVKKGGKHALKVDHYKAKENQTFRVLHHNGRYAFINSDEALHVLKDDQEDGGLICPDAGQHQSSYFEIVPVTEGQLAGQACFLRTHCGKAIDIMGGQCNEGCEVKQWSYNGGPNQIWVIAPADEKHKHKKPKSPPHGHKKHHSPPKEPANLYPSFNGWGGVPGGQGFNPVPPPQPPQPDQPLFDAGRSYYIYCGTHTNKCMQVTDHGPHSNKVTVHDFNQSVNQRFKIAPQGQPGQYLIRCVAGNRFVDLADKSGNDGGHINGSNSFDGNTTLWTIHADPKGNHHYIIKSPFGKGIDVPANDYKNDNPLCHWQYHGGPNQQWIIRTIEDPIQQGQQHQQVNVQTTIIPHFEDHKSYYIICKNQPNKCMSLIMNGPNANKIGVCDLHNGVNQRFKIAKHGGEDKFLLRCVEGNRFVDLIDKSGSDGSHIAGSNVFDGNTTAWTIHQSPNHHEEFIIKSPFGKGIDVPANDYKNDNPLCHWTYHGGPNQQWVIRAN